MSQAMTYTVQSHNVPSEIEDYKRDTPSQTRKAPARIYGAVVGLMKALVFDEQRALDEVNGTMSPARV